MSVTFQQALAYANSVSGDAKVIFHDGDGGAPGTVDSKTGLSGLKRLSIDAHRVENRAVIREFLDGVAAEVGITSAAELSQLNGLLDAKYQSGDALRAKDVLTVKTFVDLRAASELGRSLEAGGQLPAGHAASFAQHVVAHNLSLSDPSPAEARKAALKDFLLNDLAPRHMGLLGKVDGFGGRNEDYGTILRSVCGKLDGSDGFLSKALDNLLANGTDAFSFRDFENAVAGQNAESVNVLNRLPDQMVRYLARSGDRAELVAALRLAAPQMPDDAMLQKFAAFLASERLPLGSHTARVVSVREFLLLETGPAAGASVADAHGMSHDLGAALARNADVRRIARNALKADPGADAVPTPAQVQAALRQATEEYFTANEGDIREFAQMADDPPPGLVDPPFNNESLPMYINALLAGRTLTEPLLNDSGVMDEKYFQTLADYYDTLNTAAVMSQHDFGAAESRGFDENVMRLHMALNGVDASRYPEVLGRAMAKVGAVSGGLLTLASACSKGEIGGITAGRCGSAAMAAHVALKYQAKALLAMMTPEQRGAIHAGIGCTPRTAAEVKNDAVLQDQFLQTHMEQVGKTENLSAEMRAFARRFLVEVPGVPPSGGGDARSRLEVANWMVQQTFSLKMMDDAAGTLLTEKTPLFARLMNDAIAKHGLTHLTPELVNPSAVYSQVSDELKAFTVAATGAGKSITVEDLEAVAAAAMESAMKNLDSALVAIDGLREPENPAAVDSQGGAQSLPDGGQELLYGDKTVYTAEEKDAMRMVVQRYGITDIGFLSEMARICGRGSSALGPGTSMASEIRNLATPDVTAELFGKSLSAIVKSHLKIQSGLDQEHPPAGNEMALTALMDMGAKLAGLSPARCASFRENMHSQLAKTVAGCCMYLLTERNERMKSAHQANIFCASAAINSLRTVSEVLAGEKATLNPLDFAKDVTDLSALPDRALSQTLSDLSGGAVSSIEVKLSGHRPRFDRDQWATLLPICRQVTAGLDDAEFVNYLLGGKLADDLLAASAANGGTPLTTDQLWEAVLGDPKPAGLRADNFGAIFLDEFKRRYEHAVAAANPDIQFLPIWLLSCGVGIAPKKMLQLTRPGAALSLADIAVDTHLGSLVGYGANTAYGLVVDFPRGSGDLVMKPHGGETLTVPHARIPDNENGPDHPTYRGIIDKVAGMTHSEVQKARVLQTFTQTPLIMPRVMSNMFAGVQLSEHGNFSVTAEERADGAVVVDIVTDPSLPLLMHETYVIATDGRHECTRFDMTRAPVAAAAPAPDAPAAGA